MLTEVFAPIFPTTCRKNLDSIMCSHSGRGVFVFGVFCELGACEIPEIFLHGFHVLLVSSGPRRHEQITQI
jgi:hypothetical protein